MEGIFVASITPFNSKGEVNVEALQATMKKNISEGAAGFFVTGSCSECFLLTEEERILILKTASEFKDQTKLIAHIGAISTDATIRLALKAKEFGIPYIAATPPFYYGFNSTQVAQYYYDIHAAVGMPVFYYNYPEATNKPLNLADPVIQKLFKSDSIVGIKHTNHDVSQMERIKNLNPKLIILNGYDETMVAGLALGAHGNIGSTFNIMLPHYKKIYDKFLSGDREGAFALQIKANNIMSGLCSVGLIAAIKYILTKQGIDGGEPRKPFLPLNDEQKKFADDVWSQNIEN